MANLNTHIKYIRTLWNNGPISDDVTFSDRIWGHTLKQSRSRLLKIKLDKYDHIADSNYSTLCVELQNSSYKDCSCLNLPENCTILRSVKKLPKELVAKWGSTILVNTFDGSSIGETTITRNKYAKYSISNTKPKTGWFIEDGYLYILNNKKLKAVLVKGIWEDPEIAADFNDCTNEDLPCIEADDFPIDSELVYPMYQLSIELIQVGLGLPQDNKNDGRSVENIQAVEPNE